MTVLVNLGNASTDGTLVTTGNSGGTGSNAFNAVNDVATTSVTWEADNRWPGSSLGIIFQADAAAGQAAYTEWTTALVPSGTTAAQLNAACSLYAAALPALTLTNTVPLIRGLSATNQRWRVGLDGTGKIVLTGNGQVLVGTSTLTIATGTLYWIEVGATGSTTGTIECRIYNSSGTLLETMGPYTGVNLGGPVNAIRYGIAASISPSASTAVTLSHFIAADTGWQGPPATASPAVAAGPSSGAVSSSGVTAAYVLEDSATLSARLVVSTASNLLTSPVYSSSQTVPASQIVKFAVTGLTADTAYHYGIEVDGTVLADGRGTFTTDPVAGTIGSFAVAVGSCEITGADSPTYAAIASYNGVHGPVRRWNHLGDWGYPDWASAVGIATVRSHYQTQINLAGQKATLAAIPWTYLPNNHDQGLTADKTNLALPDVAAAYREFIPHYTLPAADGIGFWHSYVINRVRFINLDMRSQRDVQTDTDNSSKSMLGADQLAWLTSELQEPEPVKVIFSDPWHGAGAAGGRWGAYTYEFDVVNDLIDLYANGQVLVASGDRHALAADDGSRSSSRGRPNVVCAPINQGSNASTETWSEGYFYSYNTTTPVEENLDAFGILEFTDDGSTITCTYRGITSDGTERLTMTTVFAASNTVTKDLALSYNVAAVTSKAVALSWDVRAVATKTHDLSWDVAAIVTKAHSLLYDVRAVTSKGHSFSWDVREVVAKAHDLSWDVRTETSKALALSWDVRAVTSIALSIAWDVREVVAKSLGLSYNVAEILEKDVAISYDVRAIVANSLNLSWDVAGAVAKALQIAYNVAQVVSKPVQIVFDIGGVVSVSVALSFNVAEIVTKSKVLSWDVYTEISKDIDLLFNVSAVTRADLVISWDIGGVITRDLALGWDTYQEVIANKDLLWDTKAEVERAVAAAWDVYAEVGQSVVIVWDIEAKEVLAVTVSIGSDGPITAVIASYAAQTADIASDGPVTARAPQV